VATVYCASIHYPRQTWNRISGSPGRQFCLGHCVIWNLHCCKISTYSLELLAETLYHYQTYRVGSPGQRPPGRVWSMVKSLALTMSCANGAACRCTSTPISHTKPSVDNRYPLYFVVCYLLLILVALSSVDCICIEA